MIKYSEKKEFLFYVIKIKNHIKIQKMLSPYIQHRKYKCIHTFKKCSIQELYVC